MKGTIIIADDSAIIKNIVEKGLNDEYNILKASNGKEVINYVESDINNVTGLLLDLNMPEYDGFMVLEYFKTNNLFNRIPVAIISGDDTKETIDRAFSYNIVDMLNKPFTSENIKNIVSKMNSYHNQ